MVDDLPADRLVANALAEAFFAWVDFLAFPAIFSLQIFLFFSNFSFQIFLQIFLSSSFYFFKKWFSFKWGNCNVMNNTIGIEIWLVDERKSRRRIHHEWLTLNELTHQWRKTFADLTHLNFKLKFISQIGFREYLKKSDCLLCISFQCLLLFREESVSSLKSIL